MASAFELEIVTPDRKFFEGPVEMVIVRTVEGDMAVLKGHAALVAPLAIGSVKIKNDGQYKEAACASGFIQVRGDKTTIITDSAEWPEEIDQQRAQAAKDRAEERLRKGGSDMDVERANTALKRALNRLRVADKR